ncbi:MAG TPA: hypothetical protein IGS52_17115 [Oscillatoriaceae cyanobacterium M33_DOE_052]|uniref:Uncharacterized protein n=1 Tax=Planktothricoides sp. SpSt-374 TaxID=2282167 RepID=A0A7C3VMK1_9CYAN|nr:hypothetical protein [Oscillatoriaceae cyanobacterium M33_DOE_052]
MDVLELKFLLELLGFPDYQGSIQKLKPNPKTTAAELNRLCRSLSDRLLVAYSSEITQLKITAAGKALLSLDTSNLPISAEDLTVLQAAAAGAISAAETGIPRANRQRLLQSLADRGLIEPVQTQIKEVWLTPRGEEYLRDEYLPSGNNPLLSLDLLANYLRFLRKSWRHQGRDESTTEAALVLEPSYSGAYGMSWEEKSTVLSTSQLRDEDILQIIRDLDRQLGTDNYLPIFYLRQRLQPFLSRDELNLALYRLQRQDKIELSSLQEAIAYTPEQIEAGIPQDIGGPLFFIIVT